MGKTIIHYMKIVFKLITYIAVSPLYMFTQLFPKNKNLWVFGAWFGDKYADNCKYMFEYMNKNHPEIKIVWLTRNKKIVDKLSSAGMASSHFWSLTGLLTAMRAGVVVFSHAVTGDFVPATISSDRKSVV